MHDPDKAQEKAHESARAPVAERPLESVRTIERVVGAVRVELERLIGTKPRRRDRSNGYGLRAAILYPARRGKPIEVLDKGNCIPPKLTRIQG